MSLDFIIIVTVIVEILVVEELLFLTISANALVWVLSGRILTDSVLNNRILILNPQLILQILKQAFKLRQTLSSNPVNFPLLPRKLVSLRVFVTHSILSLSQLARKFDDFLIKALDFILVLVLQVFLPNHSFHVHFQLADNLLLFRNYFVELGCLKLLLL